MPPHPEYKVSVFCVREALDPPFIELDPTPLFYFENEPCPLAQAALEFMIFLVAQMTAVWNPAWSRVGLDKRHTISRTHRGRPGLIPPKGNTLLT